MMVYKCTINGVEKVEVDIEVLPNVVEDGDDIIVYGLDEDEVKIIYKETTSKKIIEYLNKIVKLQQSINKL